MLPQRTAYQKLIVIGALIGGVIALSHWPAEADELKDAKETILFFGPYTLADMGFSFSNDKFDMQDPDEETLQKALAKSRFYFVVKRVRKDGKWIFDLDSGYPKILAEGVFTHELKDLKDRNFTVNIVDFTAGADNIDYTVTPATSRGGVSVSIMVRRGPRNGAFISKEVRNATRFLRYDSHGGSKGLYDKEKN